MIYMRILMLSAVVFLVPANTAAQTATLNGRVSETVALSVPVNSSPGVDVVSNGNTVRMTLSGTHPDPVIRVPLLVRSNSGFKIFAAFESSTAELTQLSVVDVRATGSLVSPAATGELNVLDKKAFATLDLSRPFLVLSGPRISLGGTLVSTNNALQVTLLIRMKPQPTRGWLVHLTFSGSAISIF